MKLSPSKIALCLAAVIGLAWYLPLGISLIKPRIQVAYSRSLAQPKNRPDIANNTFSYSSLGVNAPVTVSPNTSPLEYKDWKVIGLSLKKGISLAFEGDNFDDSPLSFLSGHSSDTYPHAYATIFSSLGQASINDTFEIKVNNQLYHYRIIDKKIINPTDIKGFQNLAAKDDTKRLALVTCWPLLTVRQRLVVVAQRME